ncbi:hypothetical protein B0H11DRAFT_1638390, partial [Mycena galericulata]
MIHAAKKFQLRFTALSVSKDIQLQMPIWSHLELIENRFDKIRRKDALKCLRQNHQTRLVADVVKIAGRKTTVAARPHVVNPSGVGRRNCGCPLCRRDRNEYGCKNPGQCIDVAKELIECIQPKWNPFIANNDLCEELELSDAERARNDSGSEEEDSTLTFDP